MMFELFDEEYQRKQYNIAEAHRNEAKGIVKGMAKGQVNNYKACREWNSS